MKIQEGGRGAPARAADAHSHIFAILLASFIGCPHSTSSALLNYSYSLCYTKRYITPDQTLQTKRYITLNQTLYTKRYITPNRTTPNVTVIVLVLHQTLHFDLFNCRIVISEASTYP